MEISTSEAFLEFRFLELLKRHLQSMLESLCRLSTQSMDDLIISPLSPDRFLQLSGEVISELQCLTVTVSVELGSQPVNWCQKNILPVKQGEKDRFLLANTRMIVEHIPLQHQNCTILQRPIFVSNEGMLVTADPVIKLANIKLDPSGLNIQEWYHAEEDDIEDDFGTSLLYDRSAMSELNSIMHFGLTKSTVLNSLVHKYCQGEECGSFVSQQRSSFNLGQLEKDISDRMNFSKAVYHALVTIGSFCSIGVAAYVIGIAVMRIINYFMPGCQYKCPDLRCCAPPEDLFTQDIELRRPTGTAPSYTQVHVHADEMLEESNRRLRDIQQQENLMQFNPVPTHTLGRPNAPFTDSKVPLQYRLGD